MTSQKSTQISNVFSHTSDTNRQTHHEKKVNGINGWNVVEIIAPTHTSGEKLFQCTIDGCNPLLDLHREKFPTWFTPRYSQEMLYQRRTWRSTPFKCECYSFYLLETFIQFYQNSVIHANKKFKRKIIQNKVSN